MNENLSLIHLSEELLPTLCEWFNNPEAAGEYDGAIRMSFEEIQQRFHKGLLKSVQIVKYEGQPIGWVDVHVFPESSESATITVQISKPSFRGKGLGLRIHEMALSEFIKANEGVRWIEAWAHVQNTAEQRILEKLNFKRDTETIKQFPINGKTADFYSYELEIQRINQAREESLAQINELIQRSKSYWSYPKSYLEKALPLMMVEASYLRENLAYEIRIGEDLVGFFAFAKKGSERHLDHLWIEPSYIKSGLGHQAMLFADSLAREFGWTEIFTYPDPPAEAFYLKHGYVDTGRRIPSRIEGGPEFSIFRKTY